jgi:pyruvate formate lyase activating enzyme
MRCESGDMAPAEKLKNRNPLILEIRGNALDDGPGIRTVVFFKGCPLSCVWCHNPESKRASVEIGYDHKACVGCRTCISTCRVGAVSPDNAHFVDRSRCTLCFKCVDACPSGALSRVGKNMEVGEIVKAVLKDRPFFDTSGGGVTFSGGEPTMFMDFLSRMLRVFKRHRIHTLLETCGFFDFKKFKGTLLPYLDMIYYDIKLVDDDAHRTHTGVSNKRILENFIKLQKAMPGSATTLLPRTPLIPGITDTDGNMHDIAAFLAKAGIKHAALMQYNPLWHDKADKVGADNPSRSNKAMTEWMDRIQVDRCRKIFSGSGIEVL